MKLELATLSPQESESVLARLRAAPGASTLLAFAIGQLTHGAMIDHTSGAYLFGPNPSVAPFAFHMVVFPSLTEGQITSYERSKGTQLPRSYRELLLHFNGYRAGSTSLYGLYDVSFQMNPRAEAAYVPFDVIQEHEEIKRKQRPFAGMFPIGGVRISDAEVGKMVLGSDGAVLLFNGAGEVLRHHSTVADAVEAETARGLANAA